MPTPRWRRRAGIVGLAGLLSVTGLVGLPAAGSWATECTPGRGADLTGCNLTGQDLSAINLEGAILTGANLTGVTFPDLVGSKQDWMNGIRSGRVTGVPAFLPDPWRIVNGYLIGEGADLRSALLADEGEKLRGAPFQKANLTDADLSDTDLSSANLENANLTRANLTGATLAAANLINANLTGAVLINANLTGADLSGAILTNATLAGANFSNAQIFQTTFGPSGDAFKFKATSEDARSGPLSVEGYAGTSPSPSIPEAVIDRSVTSIAGRAFVRSTITPIGLGSIQTIGESAFDTVRSLRGSLRIPDSVRVIGYAAFYGTSGFDGDLIIGSGLDTVGDSAFTDSGFVSLRMGSGVSIGSEAFKNTALTQVVLPASLTSIGTLAFAERQVVDGDVVTPVTGGTFTFNGPAPTIASDAFDGAENLIVRYPEGAAGWPMPSEVFGTGARQIAVPRPPTPAPTPEPTPEPASNPNPMASSTAGAQPAQSTVGTPVPVPTVLRPGAGSLVIDGVSVPVTIADSGDGRTMTLSGAGVTVTLDARGPNGRPIALAPDGSLVLARGGSVPVVGSGFSPGSTVVLYLFSSPRQLISVVADATGAISTSADVPRDMPTGRHTLQIAGSTSTGQPLNLSVGLRVETPAAALGSRPRIAVPRTRVKVGDRLPITVTGAQPRCTAQLRIKGDDSAVRLGAAGRGSGVLHAPSKPGTWVVTARIKGPGCSPVVVRQAITASK